MECSVSGIVNTKVTARGHISIMGEGQVACSIQGEVTLRGSRHVSGCYKAWV